MEESRVDAELKIQMSHLDLMCRSAVQEPSIDMEINTEEDELSTSTRSGRVLRKRKSLMDNPLGSSSSEPNNRRVRMKPRKHVMLNQKQIEALYLNKKVKNVSQTLETIYEEPKTDSDTFIGGKKVKRLLTFQYQCTKEKVKKRRAKIKKLFGNKTFLKRNKIPMAKFLETLESLQQDDNFDDVIT